jgi:hypothetical protein
MGRVQTAPVQPGVEPVFRLYLKLAVQELAKPWQIWYINFAFGAALKPKTAK